MLLGLLLAAGAAFASPRSQQVLASKTNLADSTISVPFFSELERLARIVDISYCVGNTGVSKPFNCVSRCNEFPTLSLVNSWNTGLLMSDSCGYIAIDHGSRHPDSVRDGAEASEDGKQAIFVAFRGTYSIANTVVDLSTVPQKYTPYPSPDHGGDEPAEKPEHECHNCTVHLGFLESWKSARELVLPELAALKEQYPTYPIRLVGHSLGGAVACLAALELKVSLGWDDVTITTFGEPRVGNLALVRFIDEVFGLDGSEEPEQRSYRRVTHFNDPVPLLPLEEWGYMPHAGEIFISKESLSPSESDVRICIGDNDEACSGGSEVYMADMISTLKEEDGPVPEMESPFEAADLPTRYKLWQLFFAHRDYFWRLGLCVPGGDPWNWGRDPYDSIGGDEL